MATLPSEAIRELDDFQKMKRDYTGSLIKQKFNDLLDPSNKERHAQDNPFITTPSELKAELARLDRLAAQGKISRQEHAAIANDFRQKVGLKHLGDVAAGNRAKLADLDRRHKVAEDIRQTKWDDEVVGNELLGPKGQLRTNLTSGGAQAAVEQGNLESLASELGQGKTAPDVVNYFRNYALAGEFNDPDAFEARLEEQLVSDPDDYIPVILDTLRKNKAIVAAAREEHDQDKLKREQYLERRRAATTGDPDDIIKRFGPSGSPEGGRASSSEESLAGRNIGLVPPIRAAREEDIYKAPWFDQWLKDYYGRGAEAQFSERERREGLRAALRVKRGRGTEQRRQRGKATSAQVAEPPVAANATDTGISEDAKSAGTGSPIFTDARSEYEYMFPADGPPKTRQKGDATWSLLPQEAAPVLLEQIKSGRVTHDSASGALPPELAQAFGIEIEEAEVVGEPPSARGLAETAARQRYQGPTTEQAAAIVDAEAAASRWAEPVQDDTIELTPDEVPQAGPTAVEHLVETMDLDDTLSRRIQDRAAKEFQKAISTPKDIGIGGALDATSQSQILNGQTPGRKTGQRAWKMAKGLEEDVNTVV